jgi:glycosyltransferase involved in cell wall biosynthesis
MKILMSVFTRRYEGTFYRAFPWATFLAARGHDVTIICTSKKQFCATVSTESGVRIIETPALFSGRLAMTRLCGMYGWGPLDIAARYKELRHGHYDVVHVFEHHMHVALPVYLAGRKHIPVLIADWCDHYGKGGFRGIEYSPYRLAKLYNLIGFPFRLLMDHLEGDLRRRADAVTVISTYLRQRAINCGVPVEKIYRIPGSADTTQISPASRLEARNRLGLDENPPYALFFGAGQFDLDFCLEAFSLVLRQTPNARCIIVGTKDPAVTRKSAELGIQNSVIQTGWINDDRLNDWLACTDVCLLPMKDTPINHARWPNKIGFYMAASRPTVATGVNDIGELIETGDIGLVSRVDPQDFADDIVYLFTHRQLATEMGQRARRIAENEFALPIHGAELERLYLNLSSSRVPYPIGASEELHDSNAANHPLEGGEPLKMHVVQPLGCSAEREHAEAWTANGGVSALHSNGISTVNRPNGCTARPTLASGHPSNGGELRTLIHDPLPGGVPDRRGGFASPIPSIGGVAGGRGGFPASRIPHPVSRTIRTLNLAYTLPEPPFNGYDLRHLNLMRNLSGRLNQTMLCRIIRPLTPEQQDFCKNLPYDIRTVLIPRPTPLQKLAKGLRFLPGKYPVLAGGWHFKEMAHALRKILAEEHFDFIVLEGIWESVYWPIIRQSPAYKVLNLYDLEAGLLQRQANVLPPGLERGLYANGAWRMAKLEKKLPREADLIWTVSEKERQSLLRQTPGLPVYLAPGGVDCDAIQPLPPEPGKEILFVGSLQYFPNVDGVQYLVNEIMPEILKRCPDAMLRVVGRQPDDRIRQLHNPPAISIVGEVEELKPFYRAARLCIVPLRSGGGTRLKILEAMAYGRPVVSTAIGAEGIDVEHGRNILIADTPAEFADAVSRVLNEPGLAEALAEGGRRLVERSYSWKSIADIMYARYEQMIHMDKE